MKYRSVIGSGKAEFIEDIKEKQQVLKIIVSQYSDQEFNIPEPAAKQTAVIKVKIDEITGKQSKD